MCKMYWGLMLFNLRQRCLFNLYYWHFRSRVCKEVRLKHLALVGSVFSSFTSISLAPVPLSPAICQRGREGPISLAMSVKSLKAHQSLLVHISWQALPHSICLICRAEKLPREDKVRKSTSGVKRDKLFLQFSSEHGQIVRAKSKSLYCWGMFLWCSQQHKDKDTVGSIT